MSNSGRDALTNACRSSLSFCLRDSALALHLRHPVKTGFSRVPQPPVLKNPGNFNGMKLYGNISHCFGKSNCFTHLPHFFSELNILQVRMFTFFS